MSSRSKPITIVGGGLAGLTLGIGLRRHNIPVTLWEAGRYPRHRVCGEFVSGRGQDVLGRFGLFEEFTRAGAILSATASFFFGNAKSPTRRVNPPALCLSRYRMDELLAESFRRTGGELHENSRWLDQANAEATVWTTGRRLQPLEQGCRWFGLKVHARGVQLEPDLEMHVFRDG